MGQPSLLGLLAWLLNLLSGSRKVVLQSLNLTHPSAGWFTRMPTTFFVMGGAGLNWRERAFITAAWAPKATVQVRAQLIPTQHAA